MALHRKDLASVNSAQPLRFRNTHIAHSVLFLRRGVHSGQIFRTAGSYSKVELHATGTLHTYTHDMFSKGETVLFMIYADVFFFFPSGYSRASSLIL